MGLREGASSPGQWVALGRTWLLLVVILTWICLLSLSLEDSGPPTPHTQAFPGVQGPLIVSSYLPPSPLEHSALICKPLGQFKELLFKQDEILAFLKL